MTEAEAKKSLEDEGGYKEVYTWFDSPEEGYPTHVHPNERTFIIIQGAMTIEMNGQVQTYHPGDRFTIAANAEHASYNGPDGCTYVVGER